MRKLATLLLAAATGKDHRRDPAPLPALPSYNLNVFALR
jgi:hypothetical protein